MQCNSGGALVRAAYKTVRYIAKREALPRSMDHTFAEAHKLEHGDAGICKQLARLGSAGCPEQLHLHYPVLHWHLSHKGALEIKGQGAIIVCMLQIAGVLLTPHCHLQPIPSCFQTTITLSSFALLNNSFQVTLSYCQKTSSPI